MHKKGHLYSFQILWCLEQNIISRGPNKMFQGLNEVLYISLVQLLYEIEIRLNLSTLPFHVVISYTNAKLGKWQKSYFSYIHGLLYLLDMKEKTKVCIMGSMYESLYPYKTYSENIDIDRKWWKSYYYHIKTALWHKNSNILHVFIYYINKGFYTWTICSLCRNLWVIWLPKNTS